jgi:hypothetical protein
MVQTSPLLALPGELRNSIVEYVFTRELGTAPPPLWRSPLALPSTCRQLYQEFYALARVVTIFTIPWSSSSELGIKAGALPAAFASSITKLQIQLPSELINLYITDPTRRKLKRFGFAAAGLTGLEELYLRYRPEHYENGVGGPGRELTVHVLWRILWERGTESLRKICIVHDGTQPFLSLTLLHGMLETFGPLRVSKRWEVKSDLQHGRLLFVEHGHGGKTLREIAVIVGYSFREAEDYLAVCGQIIEVCMNPCFQNRVLEVDTDMWVGKAR